MPVMDKLDREQARLLAELTRQEGWPLLREFLDVYSNTVKDEMVTMQNDDPKLAAALAYKLKFGSLSILWLITVLEQIREGLDKKEDL